MSVGSFYNHTRKLFANGQIDVSALRVMLLNKHSVDLADKHISDIDRSEFSGLGWSEGGEPIRNAMIVVSNTNESELTGEDIRVIAEGGNIGPADAAVIYQDVDGAEFPLFYIDFEGEKVASEGGAFEIIWTGGVIHRWRGLNG